MKGMMIMMTTMMMMFARIIKAGVTKAIIKRPKGRKILKTKLSRVLRTDGRTEGRTDGRTDGRNFSPFYKTPSPVGAAALLPWETS